LSKLDLAIIVALLAGCAFWVEQGHRVVIDAPSPSELAATACADNDTMPYSANCLLFMYGTKSIAKASESAAVESELARQSEFTQLGARAPANAAISAHVTTRSPWTSPSRRIAIVKSPSESRCSDGIRRP